jgi:hypothetical protein
VSVEFHCVLAKDEKSWRVRSIDQTDVRNAASQSIIEKVGFKKEGILRKNFFIRGELRNCYIYSILRKEWKEPRTLSKIK